MTGYNMYVGSNYFSFDTAMKYFGNYLPQLFLLPFLFFSFLNLWGRKMWRLLEKSSSFILFPKIEPMPTDPYLLLLQYLTRFSFLHSSPPKNKNALTSERQKTKCFAIYFWFPSISYLSVPVSTALNICLNWGKRKRKDRK